MQFEKLEVWRRSSRLACETYKVMRSVRDFGFRDQICRAAVSVPSNIAEGMERSSHKDRIRFLEYARGSAGELRTQIYIGIEINYVEKPVGFQWITEAKEISSMIMGLKKTIEQKSMETG